MAMKAAMGSAAASRSSSTRMSAKWSSATSGWSCHTARMAVGPAKQWRRGGYECSTHLPLDPLVESEGDAETGEDDGRAAQRAHHRRRHEHAHVVLGRGHVLLGDGARGGGAQRLSSRRARARAGPRARARHLGPAARPRGALRGGGASAVRRAVRCGGASALRRAVRRLPVEGGRHVDVEGRAAHGAVGDRARGAGLAQAVGRVGGGWARARRGAAAVVVVRRAAPSRVDGVDEGEGRLWVEVVGVLRVRVRVREWLAQQVAVRLAHPLRVMADVVHEEIGRVMSLPMEPVVGRRRRPCALAGAVVPCLHVDLCLVHPSLQPDHRGQPRRAVLRCLREAASHAAQPHAAAPRGSSRPLAAELLGVGLLQRRGDDLPVHEM